MKYNDLIIEKFHHDTILVKNDIVIYFDPYKIDMINMPRADIILISHHHHDHCSPEDIEKVIKTDTIIIATPACQGQLAKFQQNKVFIKPNEEFNHQDVKVRTISAYNLNKYRSPGQLFHAKTEGGVGYILELNETRLYFAGDTDNIPEMADLQNIDIAFLPISGTYVMTVEEAVQVISKFQPKIIIPMHYGSVVGDRSQAEELKKLVIEAEVKILD